MACLSATTTMLALTRPRLELNDRVSNKVITEPHGMTIHVKPLLALHALQQHFQMVLFYLFRM